jgi:biofilm protein TabA
MLAGSIALLPRALARPQAVLEVLRRAADPGLLAAPLGRHDIDGDRLYLVLAEYETRAAELGAPEAHRDHCDVQVVLAGEERLGWAPLGPACRARGPYDAGKDLQLYEPVEGMSWLVATPGTFFFLDPLDVHQPAVALAAPRRVRKLVGKVHRSLLGL